VKAPAYEWPDRAEYCVWPDAVEALVADLGGTPDLRVDEFPQYRGRAVYALTFGRGKKRLFVSRPHAHEPAGAAACMELAKALAGWRDYGVRNAAWRAWVLAHFSITLVPDANPGGSARAPVEFWDGTEIANEQFFLWMFGESGEEKGTRFPRVDAWDMREVVAPALIGIAYEQLEDFLYVEPNRDYRSTFFRSFFALDAAATYDVWLDLHQTEFLNSDRNTALFLPTCQDELSLAMQTAHLSLAEVIMARWRQAGARPRERAEIPYRNNDVQRNLLNAVWRPISERMVHIVTEVQNNNPATPVEDQVRLQILAVLATLEWMA
jgi:hypothetical protein